MRKKFYHFLRIFLRLGRTSTTCAYPLSRELLAFITFTGHLISKPLATPRINDKMTCKCEDRKSTRLNSSHSQISYAVFCLKKKKKTKTTNKQHTKSTKNTICKK